MTQPPMPDPAPGDVAPLHRPLWKKVVNRGLKAFGVTVIVWLLLAYLILPAIWKHYENNPALENAPKVATTSHGIPGDPLNVGLIGTESGVVHAMLEAGWDPADPITLRTSLRIAGSVLRRKPYPEAPVSDLFVFGRKQDLAFEKPAGKSASRRHHVRFWQARELGKGGEPLWCGAVTFDRSVGLSRTTLQITHHIGADVDAERDALIGGLRKAGLLSEIYQVTGVGATLLGRNGGGDIYYTDGELTIGVLSSPESHTDSPRLVANPQPVQIKEQLWTAIRPLLHTLPDPVPTEDAQP